MSTNTPHMNDKLVTLESLEQVRQPLRQFCYAMEKKLQQNDHKGGWEDCDINWLVERARQESKELLEALINQDPFGARQECLDVANFCMMIYDNLRRMQK